MRDRAISTDTFLSWLRADAESGIFVGHIERGRSRHFSTYLNIGRVVATHPEAIDALVDNISSVLDGLPDGSIPLKLVFPAAEDDFARALAYAVASRLRPLWSGDVALVAAVRSPEYHWRLEEGPWRDPYVAVVIDWGAVTTATLRALTSLAVRAGASRVHAITLTSQLEPDAERQFHSVSAIRDFRILTTADLTRLPFPAETQVQAVEVPISAALLSRVPMGMAPGTECHLCQLAQQMRLEQLNAPTRLLRQHALRKYELYKPRPRREVLQKPATDLVGGVLTAPAAAAVWRLHLLLDEARTSTERRAQLRHDVLTWSPSRLSDSREAWIRLLTVEPHWLNQSPLDSSDVRQHIALASVHLALGMTTPTASIELRWQAVIVLRIASKAAFVDRFGELLGATADIQLLAAELCWGMYTVLGRPYNHQPNILSRALTALLDGRDRLIERRGKDAVSNQVLFTVTSLYRRAVEIRTRVSGRDDPLAAWHALQSSYVLAMNTHAGALSSMLAVLNAVSGRAAERAAQASDKTSGPNWAAVVEEWGTCWDFLSALVFPYLPTLKDLFEGSLPVLAGSGARGSITEFDSRRAASFARALADLSQFPERFVPALRQSLEVEAFGWFDTLLRAPESRDAEGRTYVGAQLLRVLSENPCDIATAWDLAVLRAAGAGLRIGSLLGIVERGHLAFCRRGLLVEAFTHIIDNAAGERHRASGRPEHGVTIEVECVSQSGHDVVSVRNNWSTADEPRQGGLAFFADEISLFGATIEHGPVHDDFEDHPDPGAWTYEVRLTLRQWEIMP
jgi:hypothetical protein